MGCNCKKNQSNSNRVRSVAKNFRNANTTIRKASNGGTRIMRRNIK